MREVTLRFTLPQGICVAQLWVPLAITKGMVLMHAPVVLYTHYGANIDLQVMYKVIICLHATARDNQCGIVRC